ncbi:MAG: PqqD family protein [bacterium]
MNQKTCQNLRTLHPKWNRKWEKTNNGRTVIIVPKFGNHPLGKWLMKRLKNPYYRLKLDEIGSFVWQQCNGMASVEEISNNLRQEFGEKVEPVQERLRLFLKQLENSKSIIWS